MTEAEALHTAARRYCRARYDECWELYDALFLRLEREDKGYSRTNHFTAEELTLFPRYLVLWPILRDIEQIPANARATADGMRELLSQIARDANDVLTLNPDIEAGKPAIEDERRLFLEYLAALSLRKLAAVKPLPYHRALLPEERGDLWDKVKERWNLGGGRWYPLGSGDPPPNLIAFDTDYFDQERVEVLRKILFDRGIKRLWEFRESVAYEIEMDSFYPSYDVSGGSRRLFGAGEESYWTSTGIDWLVYASHENSIALAGEWLVAAFETALPDCQKFIRS